MTISTVSGIQSAYPGRRYIFAKSITQDFSGIFESSWVQSGNPAAASTPPAGSGEVPTNATSGAIPLIAPFSGNTLYLARMRAWQQSASTPNVGAVVLLADRLVHTSGLSGTVTTAQTVNSVSVNRGPVADAHAYLEVYTTLGSSSSPTATISYTNQSGVSGQTGTASIASSTSIFQGIMTPIQLASGDTGVQSVESVTLSASMGTAGNFGITIMRTIAWVPITVIAYQQDEFELGFPIIPSNACLFFPSILISPSFVGDLTIVEG